MFFVRHSSKGVYWGGVLLLWNIDWLEETQALPTRTRRLLAVSCFYLDSSNYLSTGCLHDAFRLLSTFVPGWSAGWWLRFTWQRGVLPVSRIDLVWVLRCRCFCVDSRSALRSYTSPSISIVRCERRLKLGDHYIEACRSKTEFYIHAVALQKIRFTPCVRVFFTLARVFYPSTFGSFSCTLLACAIWFTPSVSSIGHPVLCNLFYASVVARHRL